MSIARPSLAIDDEITERLRTARKEKPRIDLSLPYPAIVVHLDRTRYELGLARAADAVRTR